MKGPRIANLNLNPEALMRRLMLLTLLTLAAGCDSPVTPVPAIGPCDQIDETCRRVNAVSHRADGAMFIYTGRGPATKQWEVSEKWRDKVWIGDLFRCPWEPLTRP